MSFKNLQRQCFKCSFGDVSYFVWAATWHLIGSYFSIEPNNISNLIQHHPTLILSQTYSNIIQPDYVWSKTISSQTFSNIIQPNCGAEPYLAKPFPTLSNPIMEQNLIYPNLIQPYQNWLWSRTLSCPTFSNIIQPDWSQTDKWCISKKISNCIMQDKSTVTFISF